MSSGEQAKAARQTEAVEGGSLLEQVLTVTPQTEPSRAKELVKAVVDEALKGTLVVQEGLDALDPGVHRRTRRQALQAIGGDHAHAGVPEARGNVAGTELPGDEQRDGNRPEDSSVLNASKRDLFKDLDRAVEFDQSQLFKKLYENEFGTPGGEPYGALIGDYEFTNHPEDIDMLDEDLERRGGGLLPVRHRGGAAAVRAEELRGLVQAPRPGQDLRHRGIHQVEVASATRRTRVS